MKKTNQDSDNNQSLDEIKYALFCDGLEKQYAKAKEKGLFEVLRAFKLDKKHSDKNIVQAIDYFNAKGGVIGKNAPMGVLTELEKSIVNQDGKFRPELYCMLLSRKLSQALDDKSAFILNSFKYSFDGQY